MFKVVMVALMFPAGFLQLVLGVTTDDMYLKVLTILAGVVTVALSCLIASYLRHLESHSSMMREYFDAIDKRIAAQVKQCTTHLQHILRVLGQDDEE